jgi:hypothetical protein
MDEQDFKMRIIIPVAYIFLVVISYLSGIDFLFGLLTLPWSWLMIIFSFLIIHVADDGLEAMKNGQLIGAGINVLVFMIISAFFPRRRKQLSGIEISD